MYFKRFPLALIALFLFSALEGFPQKIIESLEVRYLGEHRVSKSRILSYFASREGDIYNEERLNKNLKLLYGSGLVREASIFTESIGKQKVKVILKVRSQNRIKNVFFEGNKEFTDERLRHLIDLSVNTFVNPRVLSRAKEIILDLYQKKGYPSTEISVNFTEAGKGKVNCIFLITENERQWARKIRFEGNDVFSEKELKKELLLKEKGIFSFLTKSGRINLDFLEEDKRKIVRFYKNRGFLNFALKEVREIPINEKGLRDILFVLEEGKRFQISKISFPKKPQDLNLSFDSVVGKPFSSSLIQDYRNEILKYYGAKGYADVYANADIVDVGNEKVEITYFVNPGKIYRVGKIHLLGNEKTKDDVIRRELPLRPEDLFNTYDLNLARRRLQNIGYFEKVIINPYTESEGIRDIDIFLEEAKTGSLSFGASFNSLESLSFSAQFSESNFDISDPWRFRGGGQRLVVDFLLGKERDDIRISVIEPWFLGKRIALGTEIFNQRFGFLSDVYDEERKGISIFLRFPLGNFSSIKYGTKFQQLDIERDSNQNLGNTFARDLGSSERNSVSAEYTFDSRDSLINPRTGHRFQVKLEFIGNFLGGDVNIYKIESRFSKYWVSSRDHIIGFRSEVDFSEAFGTDDSIPIFDRFFLGGSRNLRGFDQNDVGPRDQGNQKVFGAKSSVFASLEYSIPITEDDFRFVLFTDFGAIGENRFDFRKEFLYFDAGFGIRVKTPFGPIAMDYGIPIEAGDEEADKGGQFHFYVNYHF